MNTVSYDIDKIMVMDVHIQQDYEKLYTKGRKNCSYSLGLLLARLGDDGGDWWGDEAKLML